MNEIEAHIQKWIKSVSTIRPEIGHMSICPFSSRAKYHIIKTEINNIKPIKGYDVVFFIVEEYHDIESLKVWTKYYNNKYSECIFFDDHPDDGVLIQGINTSNGKYNIITMQDRNKLYEARELLMRGEYYQYWSEEMLMKIMGEDYKKYIK